MSTKNPKFININYIENRKSHEWMNKNLSPKGKSPFIRDAVSEKIAKAKLDKKVIPKPSK